MQNYRAGLASQAQKNPQDKAVTKPLLKEKYTTELAGED
jgi:hypothetical protein